MITQSHPECRNAEIKDNTKKEMFLMSLTGGVSDVENRISQMVESGEK